MASLPKKRLLAYLFIIGVLCVLWLGATPGVLSRKGAAGAGIFKPPQESGFDALTLQNLSSDSQTSSAGATPDPFEADLRRLAALSGGDSSSDDQARAAPSPTIQPTPTAAATDTPERNSQRLDSDDGRSLFSELQPDEGSKVTDPLGGVVIRGPGAARPLMTPDRDASSPGWAGGQARGYTMLYAMQPQARQATEANVQALLSARVREPYIGVLIDGTFGRDFSYLKDIITRLSADGRALTLVLYLSNGPTMRKWDVTPIDQHIFARINPEEFRLLIRRNITLRTEFLAVVLQAKDVFSHNISQGAGNTNLAIVMLEDNLDVLAYRSLREIAAEQLGSMSSFMRNPCIGCFPGNDDDTLGDAREEHALNRFDILKAGDGYSLDGVGFRYPNGEGSGVSPEQMTAMIKESTRRNLRFFGLWQEQWQGVREGVLNKRPEERIYEPSNPDQQGYEIEMLRLGLVIEEPQDSADETVLSP